MANSVKAVPDGFHRVTAHLVVRDANAAIAFYEKAFGAEVRSKNPGPDGKTIMHAELQIGDSRIFLNDEFPDYGSVSPLALNGSAVTLHLYVEDADAAFKRVRGETHFYRGRTVQFDALLEISLDGNTRQVWSGRSAFEGLRALHGPNELDAWADPLNVAREIYRRLRGRYRSTHEYYHLNTVEIIGENALGQRDPRFRPGNLVLGLRNAHTVAILDADSWQPVWH